MNISSIENVVDWRAMQEAIATTGLRIIGVSGCKVPRLKAEIDRTGIPLLTEGKEKMPRQASPEPVVAPPVVNQITKTRLIDLPVRSGQRIYAPHCDLIVTNHVSAGAELIADGNIHVYGTMRGRALAGAGGDRKPKYFVHTSRRNWCPSLGNTG